MSNTNSSALEATKTLVRTCVRTFHPNPKQRILIDALMTYSVLHPEELTILFPNNTVQVKEIRSLLNPLAAARLVSKGQRQEVKVGSGGSGRAQTREYYYVNYHEAVDAIKFKIVKLLGKINDLYKEGNAQRKDWSCPRCKAEYDGYAILDKQNADGFYCEKCGTTLEQNEALVRERGDHAKVRIINDQLDPFLKLLGKIDAGVLPRNDFEVAWEKRRVPKAEKGQARVGWMDVKQQQGEGTTKVQAVVDAGALATTIADEKERLRMEEEAKKKKLEADIKKNVTPAWISDSAIGGLMKKEEGGASPNPLAAFKKEEVDEKKPLAERTEGQKMEDELDAYMAELEKEKAEDERKQAEEEGSEEEDEDDFEDIPASSAGTPASSQVPAVKQETTPTSLRMNGLKRELDDDGDSFSGTDTGANTPSANGPTSIPDAKRVKLENGTAALPTIKAEREPVVTNGNAADSEEDEDFEDV